MQFDVDVEGTFDGIVARLKKAARGKSTYGLDATGAQLVTQLKQRTPSKSGKTAGAWSYKVKRTEDGAELRVFNTNTTSSGVPIPILLNYGHLTGNGGYVRGSYYISRTAKPILKSAALKLKKEGRL